MDSQLTKGVVMQTSVVDIKKPLTSHIIKQMQMKASSVLIQVLSHVRFPPIYLDFSDQSTP